MATLSDAIRRADRNEIVNALTRIAPGIGAASSWLPQGHPLAQGDVIRKLSTVNATELAEYLAASAPLHVMDGWRYLARAYAALSAGDEHAATHLAYYAELRAAMAMLASEGIGIFDRTNYSVEAGPNNVSFPGTTHQVAWQAIKGWARSPASGTRLLDTIEIEGTPLTVWLAAATGRGPFQFGGIAERWIKQWGLDLDVAARDSRRRNEATYRPSGVDITLPIATPRVIEAFDGFWDASGPGVHSGSAELDYELLYRALQIPSGRTWNKKITQLAKATAPRGGSLMSNQLNDWLSKRPAESDPWLFATATIVTPSVDALPLMCRASLLLRLSSALVRRLFVDAGIAGTDIEPWWKTICIRHGFVPYGSTYAPPAASLVAEVRSAQSALAPPNWGPGVVATAREVLEQLTYPLTQIDRAGAWLLEVA